MEGITDIIELLVETEASFQERRGIYSDPWIDPTTRLPSLHEEVIVPSTANNGATEASTLGRVSVGNEYAPVVPIDSDVIGIPSYDAITTANDSLPSESNEW